MLGLFCHAARDYFQEMVVIIVTISEVYNMVQQELSRNEFTKRFIMYQWHSVDDENTFLQIRN